MAKLINLNLGWMTIGKKPWLPYDPTTDFAFGGKAKSFDLFTPRPMGSGNENLVVPSDGVSRETVSLFSNTNELAGSPAATLPNPIPYSAGRSTIPPTIDQRDRATNTGFKVFGLNANETAAVSFDDVDNRRPRRDLQARRDRQ